MQEVLLASFLKHMLMDSVSWNRRRLRKWQWKWKCLWRGGWTWSSMTTQGPAPTADTIRGAPGNPKI